MMVCPEIKADKWDLMKLKGFCTAKEIFNQVKRKPWDRRESLPALHDRGLISRIYKELKKQRIMTTIKILKMDLNRVLKRGKMGKFIIHSN